MYKSRWFHRFINKTMRGGRKWKSEKILYDFLSWINLRTRKNGILLFHAVLHQIKPVLIVLPRRLGRRIYQVPVPLETMKQYKLALKWLMAAVKKNKRMPFGEALAHEIINILFFKKSEVLRKKNEVYASVIANRAYTHFR